MADGFVWYELVTTDMDKAVTFYKTVVGWDIHDSGMPGMTYNLFGKDGKDVGGMMTWAGAGAPEMPPEWMAHIHTSNVDDEVKAVAADGGTVIRPPQDIPGIGRFAVVLDPQKAKYMLFQTSKTDTPPRLGQMDAGNVGWNELMTSDWEKAWEFYSKHYGWQKDYTHDMGPMGLYQTFKTDKPMYTGGMMNVVGIPGIPEGIHPHWKFYFTVDDIEAGTKRVEQAGGKVIMPPMDVPGGSRVMTALDDQGAEFGLMQPPKS